MIEREAGVIRAAILDAIHAQHPILGQYDERPAGQQFAQWTDTGHAIGISGVLDLDVFTLHVMGSINAVARADAAVSAEPEVDDPFPPPGAPEPANASVGPRCTHCGLFIERVVAGTGKGWRHTGTQFLGCGPDHETLAEP